jgi:ketosteroid isomerase-like protein
MSDREALLELVRRTHAARDRGDLDGVLAMFHPEAEFSLAGDNNSLSLAGAVSGHAALREALRGLIENFEFSERQIVSELADADRAAVHSRALVRFKPTGETRRSDCLDLVRFRDGKIIRFTEFADTALVRDMVSGDR